MCTATLHGYSILNTPGIYTRFRDNPELHCPYTIDYTMANATLLPRVIRWRDIYQRTGSDHIVIITKINSEELELAMPSPNWEKIVWRTEKGQPNPMVEEALKEYRCGGAGYKPIDEARNAIENFQTSLYSISKKTSLRPVHPVRLADLTQRTSIANQDATSIRRCVLISLCFHPDS